MRILIVSDNHRQNQNFFKVLDKVVPVDMIIHCGDAEGSEIEMQSSINCPFYIVTGNNDFFSELPREQEFSIGKYHVLLTHGHNYYVSMGNELLKKEAVARGKDIVMYGHTHKPMIDIEDNVIAINPGSLTYPRQEGRRPSYVLMELDKEGEAHFHLGFL